MKTDPIAMGAMLALISFVPSADAAEKRGRLTVNLTVNAQERWSNAQGTDKATVKTAQTVSFSTVMASDGEIVDFNPKDPHYAQQQMAKAAGNAQAVTAAQGQKPMTQEEFQARVQKEQAACKGDVQCLMALSQKASEWTNQMLAGQSSQAPAQEGSGSYLQYMGFDNCGAKIHITMNDVTEGSYADVQGAVPFSVKHVADYNADKNELGILCNTTNLVVDTKKNMFWSDGWSVQAPQGKSIRTDRGKTTTYAETLPFRGEVIQWASEQLRKAPLTGTRKAVVKLTNTNGTGIPFVVQRGGGDANVELNWKFEPL